MDSQDTESSLAILEKSKLESYVSVEQPEVEEQKKTYYLGPISLKPDSKKEVKRSVMPITVNTSTKAD